MIVDLNLRNKTAIVIGGGNEAQKRVNSLLNQECEILVISDSINSQISKLAKSNKIKIRKQKIIDTTFIAKLKPDIVITTTNDKKLNQKIIKVAKKKNILAYSSDNPEESDFANPAIIDFENIIQIAIFTGGQSPAMSKKLRIKSEILFKKIITKQDISQIKVQKIARNIAKEIIPTQIERKAYLHSIMNDKKVEQLIKDNQVKKAEKRAVTLLKNWK